MNILLTFDNNYSQHAGVVITSLLTNNPGVHTFYVISDHISTENQELLQGITKQHHSNMVFLFINADITKDFPIGKGTANSYVSIATYFRLFITEVLPEQVDKILYLDCDIVVNKPLDDLWNSDFEEGMCIIALEESKTLSLPGCERLHYPTAFSYFNAGVLLIDLNSLRATYNLRKAIDFIKNNDIKFHDQDVLNGLLYDKKQFMSLRFNVMDSFLIKHAKLPLRYQNERDALYHPSIIHFSGPVKPWHKECKNPYTRLYHHYLQLTPWKGSQPKAKYNGLKDKTIYLAKTMVKHILELLHLRYCSFISIP